MSTDLAVISQEEINWVKNKHAGIQKKSRMLIREAIELGAWFVETRERMGGRYKHGWGLWVVANFPEISRSNVAKYMQLAENSDLLEQEFQLSSEFAHERKLPPTITEALHLIRELNKDQKEQKPLALPAPDEFGEPLRFLHEKLKSYVYTQFQLSHQQAEIEVHIKQAKLGRRQLRKLLEYVTEQHLEVRAIVLQTFLGRG